MTLKAARTNVGLTQREVAKTLKISTKTLSGWETGKTSPKIDMVDKMCELYGVDYDSINFLPEGSL